MTPVRLVVPVTLLLALLDCAPASAPCPTGGAASASSPHADAADVLALHEIEVVFHDAGSKKDLARMMALFADDAVLTVGDKTYGGKEQVRHYFADIAAPFRPDNDLVGYTPAQRIRTAIKGDTATLYFECLWVDAKGVKPPLHTFSDDTVVRAGDGWIIKTMRAGLVSGL